VKALRFEWDPRKAAANQRKHGVSFEEARSVFLDEEALLIADPEHSELEDRFILLGLSAEWRLLVVVRAHREPDEVIRLISARKADRQEQLTYTRRRRSI
jgi:uncharacterized protein